MIIVLLLFFKSICLYCQRLVLHIHDRWINPKNVRLIKEAAEAKGSKFLLDDYRQTRKGKRRRHASGSSNNSSSHLSQTPSTSASTVLSSLGSRAENCRFCANTPQGYCRHHFHLQELQVHKRQQQQSIWCPLGGGGLLTRNVEYKQLRKIKRELKRTLHPQQQQPHHHQQPNIPRSSNIYHSIPLDPEDSVYEHSESLTNSSSLQDSGYQSIALTNQNSSPSTPQQQLYQEVEEKEPREEALQLPEISSQSSKEFLDLPTPSESLVETTYSFGSCPETPRTPSPTPTLPRVTSNQSFVSCTSSTLSTSYL
ncbi:uncharacterized protein LOC101900505 [Musca domestica]|uniref:Uncharacterized protein LOC101900505 n=1 Tax=Musca domestica TaxID=7370 RepID=A0A9J7CYJ9_MUSDO|nr:uncharacterized protein LOC101900505 [Musca domestica]